MTGSRESRSTGLHAWGVVALLWPVAVLNYLDRMMVATMRSSIRSDIPDIANDAEFGLLMAIFMWVYAALSPVGGYLADRFNRRWTILLSLLVWSAVTWLTGHAHSFTQMAWLRAAMGVSEAFYMPAALALIADAHPGGTRSRAIGLHLSGVYVGQALGGLGGWIADTSSWRNAFIWFGAAGVVYGLVLAGLLRDPGRAREQAAGAKPIPLGSTLKVLLGCGGFLLLVLHFTLPAQPGWAVKNWLPTFLSSEFGLKQGPAGLSATGYVTLASVAGVILGGVLADRWSRRTPRGRIHVSALGVALCIPALIGFGMPGSLGMAIACMMLFGLGFGLFDANNMPILAQLVGPRYRATGYGIMNFVSISAGAGITILLGRMRDSGIPMSRAFLILAVVAAVSVAVVCAIRLPDSTSDSKA